MASASGNGSKGKTTHLLRQDVAVPSSLGTAGQKARDASQNQTRPNHTNQMKSGTCKQSRSMNLQTQSNEAPAAARRCSPESGVELDLPEVVRVEASGFRFQGSGFKVQGSGFRVQGSGLRVQGCRVRVEGAGCGLWGRPVALVVAALASFFTRPACLWKRKMGIRKKMV